MKVRSLSLAGALLSALALGGCKVGPNYKAPTMPAPPAYTDDGHNGDWSSAKPADGVDRGLWWSIYQDNELDNLEQRCASANQNIAAALHAYEQAHDLVRENRASLYPTISLGGSASRNRASSNAPLRPTNAATSYWDFLIPLNISWEPDLWGGIRRQIESSAANAQATSADLANTRLSLQGLLAVTFFQLRGVDLQAQLLRSTLDAYTETLQLTEDRLKGALVPTVMFNRQGRNWKRPAHN
ncbi:TolC family protein [Tunturiibacter gelidiferens]|uniref:TolC family protein n=1 Tax=Tunturiibacter gelidiferens TaxID=3069689 RepID=UPI003D9B0D92